MEAANVTTSDEADDGFWHGALASRGIFRAFYGGLAEGWRMEPEIPRNSETRPPAEGITWGRK